MNLTADQLGNKGENRFRELCADAQLICNSSDRDRAGWDFIVEGDFDAPAGLSLDHRRSPLACHVQVKTVSKNTRSVRLKLNMAERLAKELKPSFICVIVVNDQLLVDSIFLMQMSQNRLESVLKRLRKHSASSASEDQLNRSSITFTPSPSERISPTGAGLREALHKICGSDMAAYAARKQQQLKRLGYKGAPYEVKLSMPVLSSKEMGDIFLGLKKDVETSSFELFETRFGIRLPKDKSQLVKITVTPNLVPCQLIVRGPGCVPVSIRSEMKCISGVMTGGSTRVHLQNEILRADFYPESDAENSEFEFYHDDVNAHLSQWQKGSDVLRILRAGSATIELVTENGNQKVQLHASNSETRNDAFFTRIASVIHGLNIIGKNAGLNLDDIRFSRSDLISSADKILMVSAMIENQQLALALPAHEILLACGSCRPLVAGSIRFKSSQLAYSFLADLEIKTKPSKHELKLSKFELRGADWIELSHDAYKSYENEAKAHTKAKHVFNLSASVELLDS